MEKKFLLQVLMSYLADSDSPRTIFQILFLGSLEVFSSKRFQIMKKEKNKENKKRKGETENVRREKSEPAGVNYSDAIICLKPESGCFFSLLSPLLFYFIFIVLFIMKTVTQQISYLIS